MPPGFGAVGLGAGGPLVSPVGKQVMLHRPPPGAPKGVFFGGSTVVRSSLPVRPRQPTRSHDPKTQPTREQPRSTVASGFAAVVVGVVPTSPGRSTSFQTKPPSVDPVAEPPRPVTSASWL